MPLSLPLVPMKHGIHLSSSMEKPKRFRANSISGRLRSLSELIEEGMIETRQKVGPPRRARAPLVLQLTCCSRRADSRVFSKT